MNPNTVVEIPLPHGGVLEMGNEKPLTIIAGPCQLESREHGLEVSQALKEIADRLGEELWTMLSPISRREEIQQV